MQVEGRSGTCVQGPHEVPTVQSPEGLHPGWHPEDVSPPALQQRGRVEAVDTDQHSQDQTSETGGCCQGPTPGAPNEARPKGVVGGQHC